MRAPGPSKVSNTLTEAFMQLDLTVFGLFLRYDGASLSKNKRHEGGTKQALKKHETKLRLWFFAIEMFWGLEKK